MARSRRSRWQHKEIASLQAEMATRPEGPVVHDTYALRHHAHRSVYTGWWVCNECHSQVAPFESHGHLT